MLAPKAPPALESIFDAAERAGCFKAFCSALRSAGLAQALQGAGPFTVFVPTDDAFDRVPQDTLQQWLLPGRKSRLKQILSYHVVPGRFLASEIVKSSTARTVQGTGLTIHSRNNKLCVNNATVLRSDIVCSNGVIHVVDTVVVPR
ncbi:MAG TPA: fasciclin domain-containing protein [Candidatus Polarisedimenticolia bacterium]|nr:fasciclin domain-containing protein [Candidatus Polarisedimenticolia bacterium]